MPLNKFTATKVNALVKAAKPGWHGDGGGLWLQTTRTGTASWIFRYRAPADGRPRVMGLGPLHTVSLGEARDAAALARKAVFAGQDPMGVRTVHAVTFAQCVRECLAERDANKQPTVGWQTILNHVSPVLGAMSVAAIVPEDVLRALRPFWTSQPAMATKMRRYIETVLNYAAHAKHLRAPGANPAAWDVLKHFGLKSAAELIEEKVKHYASLLPEELPEFMRELALLDDIAARALEFLILTASRTGDLIGQKAKKHEGAKPPLCWSHIDLDRRIWTIPVDKAKNKNFEVPLSDAVVALLRALPREGERVFVMGKDAMRLTLLALRPDVKVHGFRSTFSGWAKNRDQAEELVEAALKHKVYKTDVQKAYSEHVTRLPGRTRLMQLWAEFATGAEVHEVVHFARTS